MKKAFPIIFLSVMIHLKRNTIKNYINLII